MKNIFIIHGFMGSNIENWFPWFKRKIDSENTLCVIPQFPIEIEKQNYNEWKKLLDVYKDYGMINNETILIGHSTGSACAIKYILDKNIKINKLILISGFNGLLDPDPDDLHNKVNPTFYVSDALLKDVKNYANEIICMYGDDDPYIPQPVLHSLSEKLNAKEIIIPGGGHLNSESGYDKFEELLKYIN